MSSARSRAQRGCRSTQALLPGWSTNSTVADPPDRVAPPFALEGRRFFANSCCSHVESWAMEILERSHYHFGRCLRPVRIRAFMSGPLPPPPPISEPTCPNCGGALDTAAHITCPHCGQGFVAPPPVAAPPPVTPPPAPSPPGTAVSTPVPEIRVRDQPRSKRRTSVAPDPNEPPAEPRLCELGELPKLATAAEVHDQPKSIESAATGEVAAQLQPAQAPPPESRPRKLSSQEKARLQRRARLVVAITSSLLLLVVYLVLLAWS